MTDGSGVFLEIREERIEHMPLAELQGLADLIGVGYARSTEDELRRRILTVAFR